MTAITTTGMVTPIAAFAPLDRPPDDEFEAGEETLAVAELCDVVIDERVEVEVVEKAAKSLLCHQIGIPSPQNVYAESVIVVVRAGPGARTPFDRVGET